MARAGPLLNGLTSEQVQARRRRRQVNRAAPATSRPLSAILKGNLLTLFNGILAAAVVLLLLVGQTRDAVLVGGLIIFSVAVSTVQEIRAKIRLDQIALLARAPVAVIRDGREQRIRPDEVVLGDVVVLAPGDQVVADGRAVRSDGLELDESLLTGESEPVPKQAGDDVLSGSFCLAGSGAYETTGVGRASYVHRITTVARRYKSVRTPIQRFVDRVLEILLIAVVGLSVLQAIAFLVQGASLVEAVRATAVIATLVPQGLLLMSTAAYSLGALRIARRHGLVQQLNALESLSHVDVLCMDKTGTLTTNRLEVREVIPLGQHAPEVVTHLVAVFAASTPQPNATLRAIADRLPGEARSLNWSVPFHSERRWSALAFADADVAGAFVLGAPEALLPAIADAGSLASTVETAAAAGQRVLLFARAPSADPFPTTDRTPRLPAGLEAIALVALEEEIRPNALDTVKLFADLGVALKIISGDHPQTALALARRAGLPAAAPAFSGAEPAALSAGQLAAAADRTAVFGRITPPQKQQIIRALAGKGHYVAMVGDGANDVLALHEAHLGIAMQSGSPAARAVADLILLENDLGVLPATLDEGRAIVRSMHQLIKLFVIRDVATIGLILLTGFVGLPFPLLPPHVTLIAFFAVGVPSVFLVTWALPEPARRRTPLQVARFVLLLGGAVALALFAVYVFTWLGFGADVGEARTAVATAAVLSGLLVVVFLSHALAAPLQQIFADRRLVLLVAGLWLAYLALLGIPATRAYFELSALAPTNWLILLLAVGLSFGGLRFAARSRFASL